VSDTKPVPAAVMRRRRRFSLIWLVPILAFAIALYLAVTTLLNRGPLVTITFRTANGITAQQTEVKHKNVTLGKVEDVHLSHDMSQVVVHVRMNRQGGRISTDHSRFWVVRPRLTPGNISGLETLVSGAYIEVDPGDAGGAPKTDFAGLEDPPAVRSDEPGTSYVLKAGRLGSIGPGTPIFYRDVSVGEVLSYDLGDGLGPVTINIFVRSPYDKFVEGHTHFWNASGVSVSVGAQGIHLELESLQAILSGGIAFETPRFYGQQPPSKGGTQFRIYDDKLEADAAGFKANIPLVTYFQSSVGGLERGSPVEIFGIQIGTVTNVRLVMDSHAGSKPRARVAFDLQPERVFSEAELSHQDNPRQITSTLVGQGMRAVLESSNFLTGQKAISMEWVPGTAPGQVSEEGDALVLPSQSGGLDNITASISDIATKLDQIPFADIGRSLASTLKSVDRTVSGPDVQNALRNLSSTLADVQHLVRKADAGVTPVLQKLPRISADLQQAIARLNAALGEGGYGGNSDFQRDTERLLDQVNEAARSIRLLADFLDRHPEALIRGRTSQATER
jgi:paraquat-inducible protein B